MPNRLMTAVGLGPRQATRTWWSLSTTSGKTLHTFGFREQGRRTRARLKDRHPIPLLPQSIDKDAEIVGSWDFPH
jgi:hypothetical protein